MGFRHFGRKNLAATYSRGVYKTTTIGKTVFDGRVRNGNGSDHSFMATKKERGQKLEDRGRLRPHSRSTSAKVVKEQLLKNGCSLKIAHRRLYGELHVRMS